MCKNVALKAGPLAGLQKLVHLNKQENLRTSHLEAYQFKCGGRSKRDLLPECSADLSYIVGK